MTLAVTFGDQLTVFIGDTDVADDDPVTFLIGTPARPGLERAATGPPIYANLVGPIDAGLDEHSATRDSTVGNHGGAECLTACTVAPWKRDVTPG